MRNLPDTKCTGPVTKQFNNDQFSCDSDLREVLLSLGHPGKMFPYSKVGIFKYLRFTYSKFYLDFFDLEKCQGAIFNEVYQL